MQVANVAPHIVIQKPQKNDGIEDDQEVGSDPKSTQRAK